jgi:hypothetical protein
VGNLARAGTALQIAVAAVLTTCAACAATSWDVGLNGASAGASQSGAISNVSISAVASPGPSSALYPGSTGDVVLTISNPNPFPVTITAVHLPTNTTYADGYTSSTLATKKAGCSAFTPSGVIWSFSSSSMGSIHTLTSELTVAPSGMTNDPLIVTLRNAALMNLAASSACASSYFSMPSLTGITATSGTDTVTSSPAADAWTS